MNVFWELCDMFCQIKKTKKMDVNFEFPLSTEESTQLNTGFAQIYRLFYSEEKGNMWNAVGKDKYKFNIEGETNVQFKVGRLFLVQILEWTSPQPVLNRSLRIMAFFGGVKWPYVVVFPDQKSRDAALSTIQTAIEKLKEISITLIDTEVTYFGPISTTTSLQIDPETEGIPGILNVTKTGLIFLTPNNPQIGDLLINMKAYKEINPRAEGENRIHMININRQQHTGFDIELQFKDKRDEYLQKIVNLIEKCKLTTTITIAKPTHNNQEKQDSDDQEAAQDDQETFVEFPSIVLEGINGEENDEIIFNEPAKIFILTEKKEKGVVKAQWEFFGAGELHINCVNNKYRMVMRRGLTKLICLNMAISKNHTFILRNDRMITFSGNINQLEKSQPTLLEFKDTNACFICHFFLTTIADMK